MRAIAVLAALVLAAGEALSDHYYFDPEKGDDANSGRTEAEAFCSPAPLAALSLRPGDVVHLRRGGTFRGPLSFSGDGTEGSPVRITAYGEGPKPEILGSIVPDQWELEADGSFRTQVPPERFVGRRNVYGVYEYDGPLPRRLLKADSRPLERGRFLFDEQRSMLWVATADGSPPTQHRIEVSVVEQLVDLTGRHHLELTDLAFLFGNCRHLVLSGCNDVTVRNCASLFVGYYGNPNVCLVRDSTRVRLLDCFLYDSANCGVFISSGATENEVAGCTIAKCTSNDGVTCHSGGRDANGVVQGITGNRNTIRDNVIGLCPEESIDITSGDYHLVSGNLCYGNGNPGIIVGHDADHIRIDNNICFRNARSGIQVASNTGEGGTGYIEVTRNLVYDNGYPGLEIQSPYTSVLNNTVVDSRERVAVRVNEASVGSFLRNNLILTLDPTIPHASLQFISCTPASLQASLSHNLFFHAGRQATGAADLVVTDEGRFTLESFVAKYATGDHSLLAEPLLTGLAERLYLLTPDSPAVDAGVDVGLPYTGTAPDLGWQELGSERDVPRYPRFLIDGTDDDEKVLALWGKHAG